jgi:hypothetical protein
MDMHMDLDMDMDDHTHTCTCACTDGRFHPHTASNAVAGNVAAAGLARGDCTQASLCVRPGVCAPHIPLLFGCVLIVEGGEKIHVHAASR